MKDIEIQRFGKQLQSGVDEERAKLMELAMRWAVEARKRGRGAEQEQRRQEEQGQNTGRGSVGLVRGGDEGCRTDETSRKGKGKGVMEERVNMTAKQEELEVKEDENLVMDEDQENMRATTSEQNHEEDVRKLFKMVEKEEMELEMMRQEEMEARRATGPSGAQHAGRWLTPQATSDPRKETRKPRWADCEDDERQLEGKKEQETEKETRQETGQEELTNERPPKDEKKEGEKKEEKEQRRVRTRGERWRRGRAAKRRLRKSERKKRRLMTKRAREKLRPRRGMRAK